MVSDRSDSFGVLLRQHRCAAGLTQDELAARSGLSVRTIAYLEADRRGIPRGETVLLLADALGLSAAERAYFLGWARPDEVTSAAALPATALMTAEPALHPLVGRDEVLGRLDASLQGQGPPVFLLAGEPGIGKSRLLREAARRAVQAGWTVLAGGSRRQGGEAPYAPLLEALQHHLTGYDPRAQRRVLAGCAWLVRLLPELGDLLEPLPAGSIPPEHERRLLVDAIARLLANVSGPGGTLLLLDDLQWAGPDTLDLLAALVRHPRAPVRIVGAYRDTEVGPASPLQQLVADLVRAGLVAHQPLGPLSEEEAASLLASLLAGGPQDGPEVVRRALERAGGMPFFLVSYAQALRSGGAEAVPWDLAAAVRQRVALVADATEVLGIGAVVGRQVPRSLLLAVSQQPEDSVLAGLEAACRARLLLEDGPDAYVFAHDVIREVIEEDLGAARRAFLHRRVAEVLERQGEAAQAELLAYHYARSLTPDKALPYLEAAGDQALAQYAYDRAEGHYRRLVERLEKLGREGDAARVQEKLGELLRRLGRLAEAQEVLMAAVTRYREVRDLEGAGRAMALLGFVLSRMAEAERARREMEGMVQLLDGAVASRVGPSAAAARLWEQLASVYLVQGRYEEMLRAAHRAEDIARALGDEELLGRAVERRGAALTCLGRLEEGREALEGAIRRLERAGTLPVGAMASLVENRRLAGELAEALERNGHALELAARTGIDTTELAQHLNRAELLTAVGEWKRARQHLARAEEIAQTRETAASTAAFLPYHRGELALRQGRWQEAAEELQRAITGAIGANDIVEEVAQTLLAELEVLTGKPQAAQHRLTALLDRAGGNLPHILSILAWSHVETAEIERGLQWAEQAVHEVRRRQTLLYLPEALRLQGMALARLGRYAKAKQVLTEGRERAHVMPDPYTEARLLVELGRLERREGQDDEARERLEEALAIFRRLGAARDVERTAEELMALSHHAAAAPSQYSPGALSQKSDLPLSQNSAPSQKSPPVTPQLTDAQWERIAALLPPRRPGRGRPRADDRQTLEAILYVRRSGCGWADVPSELGSGATAHRRWQEWQTAGLWEQIVALAETLEPGASSR